MNSLTLTEKPDVIITDPPRAGMHPRVTQLLADLKSDRIVYVSCNSATQARDLEVLGQSYEVVKIQPVDMFPQTAHVENVVFVKVEKVNQEALKSSTRSGYFRVPCIS